MCKECRHGVLPSQVKSHLQQAHTVKRKQAKIIADKISSWTGLIKYASELEVPDQIIKPVYQLPVYVDRLMCQIKPEHCRQICQSREAIRKH